jgi:hypothetical protein
MFATFHCIAKTQIHNTPVSIRRASLYAWRKIADPPDVAFREIHVDLFRTERAESPF